MNPTQNQLCAIQIRTPKLCIPAGAGSGKTSTVIERVRNIGPRNVTMFTFTQAGAREMAKRIAPDKPRFVGTIHAFCFSIIQRFGELIGYHGRVSIIDEETQKGMFDEIRTTLGYSWMSDAELDRRDSDESRFVWKEYHFRLKKMKCVDYDLILELGAALLEKEPVRKFASCEELIVDEAQDSGEIDWEIIRLFPASRKTIIGDPDQSIYAFRGGRPDLFLRFAKEATIVTLEECFRCDTEICFAANDLIAKNKGRLEKKLKPVSKEEGSVTTIDHGDERAELRWMINELRDNPTIETAVLGRTNWVISEARKLAREENLPVYRAPSVPNQKEFSKALALIGLLIDNGNDILAERYLRLTESAKKANLVKLTAMADTATINAIAKIFPPCLEVEPRNVGQVLAKKGIHRDVLSVIEARAEAAESLPELLRDLYDREGWEEGKSSGIVFSTVHGAKGREWDRVIVLGMEEGTFPILGQSADIEEERRLGYVAFTRARHQLLLSHCQTRRREFGGTTRPSPSRFLEEAGL